MTQPLTPTQADIIAASELICDQSLCGCEICMAKFSQAFARHAQAARLEGAREVERLREALREIAMQSDRPAGELPMGWSRLAVDSIHKIAIASLDPLSIAEKGV